MLDCEKRRKTALEKRESRRERVLVRASWTNQYQRFGKDKNSLMRHPPSPSSYQFFAKAS